jgi:hypothetical protein
MTAEDKNLDHYLANMDHKSKDDEFKTIRRMKIPISGVSDDGSVYGTITKEMREEVDFNELIEHSNNIKGYAVIYFEE